MCLYHLLITSCSSVSSPAGNVGTHRRQISDLLDQSIHISSQCFVVTADNRFILLCGFWDKSFRVYSTDTGTVSPVKPLMNTLKWPFLERQPHNPPPVRNTELKPASSLLRCVKQLLVALTPKLDNTSLVCYYALLNRTVAVPVHVIYTNLFIFSASILPRPPACWSFMSLNRCIKFKFLTLTSITADLYLDTRSCIIIRHIRLYPHRTEARTDFSF